MRAIREMSNRKIQLNQWTQDRVGFKAIYNIQEEIAQATTEKCVQAIKRCLVMIPKETNFSYSLFLCYS